MKIDVCKDISWETLAKIADDLGGKLNKDELTIISEDYGTIKFYARNSDAKFALKKTRAGYEYKYYDNAEKMIEQKNEKMKAPAFYKMKVSSDDYDPGEVIDQLDEYGIYEHHELDDPFRITERRVRNPERFNKLDKALLFHREDTRSKIDFFPYGEDTRSKIDFFPYGEETSTTIIL